MNRRVFVTGGAGYIGSILCSRLLEASYHVTVLDNLMYRQKSLLHICSHPNFTFVKGDVRDDRYIKMCIRNADIIIPLAAIVGAHACDVDPQLARAVNLECIQKLNAMRGSEQLIIFPTTNSGYGTKSGDIYCTEDTPLEPVSLYGKTKVLAEKELLEAPNVISLRLATIFGISPRMRIDLLVNHFVYAAVTDKYLVIFEKDYKRNYIHIQDIADCFLHCIENANQMVGRPYNVGLDDANLSKDELAQKVKEHVPDFYIHCAEIGSDPDKRNYIVSNQRLKTCGFTAKWTIDEGILELIKGYQMLVHSPYKNS